MASDVTLYIAHPDTGAVICRRWIGGRMTMARARQVLARSPDSAEVGWECWGGITAKQAESIWESRYECQASEREMLEFADEFPDDSFWWILEHGF